ncbi:glycosyltransferase [Flavobacterium selenitireducens]|uniref:glycosyltransferase n=1 Tax=Flavobacterium selenitireducens TaxID=2722704 RepID=UPI00168C0AC8|nr:glycosyltransferase [Flavobacterium selenitireducens]MBD3582675.1 glycosyltransferase [Flavobacterium selenitireducens]
MPPLKICLVGNSLSFGGADKIHAVLSNYLSDQGFDVHNIIFIDAVTYEFSGKLLNLGKTYKTGGIVEVLKRFRMILSYIRRHDFDYIIDFRTHHKPVRELLLSRLMSCYRYIPTVHSYKTEWYLTSNRLVSKMLFAKASQIVCVSDMIEQKLRTHYGYHNVRTIHNPLETAKIVNLSGAPVPVHYRYIIAAGRMANDDHKQFKKLIRAYAESDLARRDIRLMLIGDGPLKDELVQSASDHNVSQLVVFGGFVTNPYPLLKKAEFTVLTSKFEGLPNIIAESLAVGTPVVSFDCKSGPADLIQHRRNGLLVPDQDWSALTGSLDEMAQDGELREHCRCNARQSVARLDVSEIGNIWKKLLT